MLIAERPGEAVGYLWFDVQERPPTPFTRARRRLYIQHVAVSEAARRSGVGTALIEAVEAEARARGITRLALDAWSRNTEAQIFIRTRGFQPFNVVLGRDLG